MMIPQAKVQTWPKPVRERSIIPASRLDALVVTALRTSPVPLSAYAIADRLRDQGHRVVIPSIYRSLRRLSGTGVVEKVEMLSAYRIADGDKRLRLVCLGCGRTVAHPIPEFYDLLIASVQRTGFEISKVALEIAGRCAECDGQEGRS